MTREKQSPGQTLVGAARRSTRPVYSDSANWHSLRTRRKRALIDTKQVEDQRLVFAFARVQNRKLRCRSKLFI
jgi:hypothetical protein